MDPRLLHYYNNELGHLREMGAEFAERFPKIAGRLGMQGIEVTDPYVERLLEGFAFLAARVQLKLDAEFPRFTARLLEVLYPNFLAPVPSMMVARLDVDPNDPGLATGMSVPRGTALRGETGSEHQTVCEYRTAHTVQVLPIQLVGCSYFGFAPDLSLPETPAGRATKSGLRMRLKLGGGLNYSQLSISHLPIYLGGNEAIAFRLYELMLGACTGMLISGAKRPAPWRFVLGPQAVRPLGFEEDQALLPVTNRGFQGYRLLQEYFAFPARFLFVDLCDLDQALRGCTENEIEVVLLFSREEPTLESTVDTSCVHLFCTPAINLYPRRTDRVLIDDAAAQYHVVVDRTRPMDFEVHGLNSVTGYGAGNEATREFWPLYAAYHGESRGSPAYYTLQREPRLLSERQRLRGARSSYIGSEVFISLVDPLEAPYPHKVSQLSLSALVTNRDLPLLMAPGGGRNGLQIDSSVPISMVRVLRGPSRPLAPSWQAHVAWQLINLLSFNHLALTNEDDELGAAALRELLDLFAAPGDPAMRRQVEGVRSVAVNPLVRRLPIRGPVAFGRGVEVKLEVDELAFEGASSFLFGAVMERFLARHVSINNFTETVLHSTSRGEVMRWRPRCGLKPIA